MTTSARADTGFNGHRMHPGNGIRAGIAEAVGTFFLIYTGTATAAAGAQRRRQSHRSDDRTRRPASR